ncbi:hypothetical protein VNO78_14917 [Psophocarpus tetragonolobus]|uniref:Uncharacterized protein n=1 Tax=Psophocarpus tetragonolobus TaxID=3891 RepID=A0AAN9SFG6_PSOTE
MPEKGKRLRTKGHESRQVKAWGFNGFHRGFDLGLRETEGFWFERKRKDRKDDNGKNQNRFQPLNIMWSRVDGRVGSYYSGRMEAVVKVDCKVTCFVSV